MAHIDVIALFSAPYAFRLRRAGAIIGDANIEQRAWSTGGPQREPTKPPWR